MYIMIKNAIFHLLIPVFLFSCGNIQTSSYNDKPLKTLRNYTALEITDFISFNPEISDEFKTIIPRYVENKLLLNNIGFQKVRYGSINDVSSKNTLVMLAEITDIQSSRDFKFQKGTLKFGESSLSIQMAFVQKDTGEEVLTGEVVGFSSSGLLGGKGDSEKMIDHIANEIINLIAANY